MNPICQVRTTTNILVGPYTHDFGAIATSDIQVKEVKLICISLKPELQPNKRAEDERKNVKIMLKVTQKIIMTMTAFVGWCFLYHV